MTPVPIPPPGEPQPGTARTPGGRLGRVSRLALPPSRYVDIGGPVHYLEWDGPPGRTFVLVHGLGGSHLQWLPVGPLLARLPVRRKAACGASAPRRPS